MTTSGDDVVATAVDFLERQLVGKTRLRFPQGARFAPGQRC
jgi:hypothetical protein